MREIFKAQLEEFHKEACLDLFYTGEDGSGPSPMKGDRFFVMEKSAGDEFDSLFMWSAREEEFHAWNEDGWWETWSDKDVPDEAIAIVKNRAQKSSNDWEDRWLEEMEELYSMGQ